MAQLQAAIKDKTNRIKYQADYRMRMKDNQYQWFRAAAEGIRRLDGSVSRIAGIFINIDAKKKEIMQAQKSAAFHRAFTKADLCEYYVNLEANTFDTFKVEPSLMTVFEQSRTWDELIRHFVDSYVVETDKKAVSSFYDRGYIAERLKGLETELSLECRITLNGEERWVRNVVIRGEIEDSEYAMIFLRDITEAKAESKRHLQMEADNASMEQLIQSIVHLFDRFVVCDLENDRYECYTLNGQRIYKPLGFYHDWQMQVLEKYKTLEPLEAIDILIAPDNIRKKLKSENDIYKFEYCSLDEKTYKIASYIPLEWKNGKLEKVLLASMNVTQEKKAEIESRQALKEAYRSAENANRAKTEFPKWAGMLSQGLGDAVRSEIHSYLNQLNQEGGLTPETLFQFHEHFLPLFLGAMQHWEKEQDIFSKVDYDAIMQAYASLPQMLQFVDFVTEYVENSASKGKCQGRSQIERILSYIQKNLTRNISRSEISKALYLNPEYLSRLFKREMGIGLAEYLIQERMRLAQSLLKNTSFSISIIASRVGYVNFSHFAKVFKQEFGVSPSEYRKMCDPQGK